MQKIHEQSIEAHKKYRGKIAISGKMPVNDKRELSIAYTPGVAGPCLEIAKNPEMAREMVASKNTVAVITDGSAVLGLGNIGPEAALPVMEGKALIFKEFAGIDAFPIALDTQDTEEIIRTIKHIAPTFGGINIEDIAAPRCFEIENRLRNELSIPVIHDDQNGTAIVVLAGLINSLKLRESSKEDVRIVISGAGAAGIAVTKILLEYGFKNIVVNDSKGAIYHGQDNLNEEKEKISKLTNTACHSDKEDPECMTGDLKESIKNADIFVGVSKGGILTKEMVKEMAPNPIIFAMANPDPEILPADAKEAGAYIVATGRSDYPNQVNNALVFPGLFRGALDNNIKKFDEKIFIRVAEALAEVVKKPTTENILPSVFDKNVVPTIANVFKR